MATSLFFINCPQRKSSWGGKLKADRLESSAHLGMIPTYGIIWAMECYLGDCAALPNKAAKDTIDTVNETSANIKNKVKLYMQKWAL